jgi:hypothetical protein
VSDLVKRLRAPVLVEREDGIRLEAADEIMRLRADVRASNKTISENNSLIGKMAAAIKQLKRAS